MLRDTGLVRGTAPQWRRGLAVATLLGAAVLLSGFRPPEGGLAAAAEELTGEELAQADNPKRKARKERKRLQEEAAAASKDGGANFDLTYVPAETQMLVGLRPAAMSAVKGFQPLTTMIEQNVRPEQTGLPVKNVDQFLIMAIPPVAGGDPFSREPAMAIRATKATTFEKFITWSSGGDARGEKEHNGRKYVIGQNGKTYYTPDDRNLIFCSEDVMRRVIDLTKDGATPPSWNDEFQTVSNSQFCYVLDMNAARAMLAKQRVRGGAQSGMFTMFSPLWEKTRVTAGGIQFGTDSRAIVTAWCKNKDDAVGVQRTVQSLIPLAQNMLAGQKSQLPKIDVSMRGQISAMVSFLEKFLDDVKVEMSSVDDSGAKVELTVKTDAATIPLMVGLTLPAIQSARAAARRTQSMNNMKQLGLAMHNYHATHKEFPAAALSSNAGKTTYSWRVALLPFLGEKELYDAYRQDQPWDSEENLKVLKQMPNVYRHPNEDVGATTSSYFALAGKNTGLGNGEEAIMIRDMVDGTSNTVMLIGAKRVIPWTKPEDIKYSPDEDVPALGGYEPGGFLALLGDGSVRFIVQSIDEKVLRAMITRNGNEIIDWSSISTKPGGQQSLAP